MAHDYGTISTMGYTLSPLSSCFHSDTLNVTVKRFIIRSCIVDSSMVLSAFSVSDARMKRNIVTQLVTE